MKLYNTLTRKVEDFEPTEGQNVKLYTCGPTVYNYYHIGNLRNAVFNDTLRRTLEASDYKVQHVMNITDVGHLVSDADEGEDKLEKGAKREGKTVWEVAEQYTEAFKSDMKAMNVLPPNAYHSKKYDDSYARATEFIDQQIEMVKTLLAKGFAYQTKQAIYFDVTKIEDYGELSGQKLSDKEIGARTDVVTDPEKHHPYDFAVWFLAVEHFAGHTMQWDSPWGSGFPGWHLECSAIIHATLGDPIDIHTGGVDHIGTHHPNEMAQTEAVFGHPLSRFWVHNEFILVDGAKMSKSKGNSYTLQDVKNKGYDPLALRMLYLQAHYRSELNFSWENLEAAQQRLNRWQAVADLRWQLNKSAQLDNSAVMPLLINDLGTPKTLSIIDEFFDNADTSASYPDVRTLRLIDELLGINLLKDDVSESIKNLISNRESARAAKNWHQSDEIRDKLKEQGIGVRDTDNGQIWFRL